MKRTLFALIGLAGVALAPSAFAHDVRAHIFVPAPRVFVPPPLFLPGVTFVGSYRGYDYRPYDHRYYGYYGRDWRYDRRYDHRWDHRWNDHRRYDGRHDGRYDDHRGYRH